jgi:hypothetical protein
MYKCLQRPNPVGKGDSKDGWGFAPPDKVLPIAKAFIENWKAQFTDRQIYVDLKCFPEPTLLYVNSGFRHIEGANERLRKPSPAQIARRYRFLPCVRELLENSKETPEPTRDGNLMLSGKTEPYNERFKVIFGIGELPTGKYDYKLITFYPVAK